jgi:hypothetical protein
MIDFSSPLNVGGEVNLFREFGDVDLETVLNLVEDLGVSLVRHEGDGEALEENYRFFRRSSCILGNRMNL